MSANAFGIFEHGNVWEWRRDCWRLNYNGAAIDGFYWTTGDCSLWARLRAAGLNDCGLTASPLS
ncbi:MAG: hypothetical protein KF700_07330 [Hyphomonadaceae bacterium]|nr:hypothetical protein [Hyphomonadaceae bacterium]